MSTMTRWSMQNSSTSSLICQSSVCRRVSKRVEVGVGVGVGVEGVEVGVEVEVGVGVGVGVGEYLW